MEELEKDLINGSDQEVVEETTTVEKTEEPKMIPITELEDAINALKQVSDEKENYKKMAFKYKKASKSTESDDEEFEDEEDKEERLINKMVERIKPLIDTKSKEEIDYVKKVQVRYEELKNAIQNSPKVVVNDSASSTKENEEINNKLTPSERALVSATAKRLGVPYKEFEAKYIANKS
jgi:hypothetical protein